jgi:hypothetical protein
MRAEVLTTAVGDAYAAAVEGSEGSETRGISIRGDRLTVWTERDGRREVLLDALLDEGDAGLLFEALKRIKDPARFDEIFDAITNAEMCTGDDGRIHICDEDFGHVVEILLEEP